MKARHAAVLGGYLAVYDLVFTALLPVTDNLFARLSGLPCATFPVMVVLGPLMIAQVAFWRHRRGTERTFWQFAAAQQAH